MDPAKAAPYLTRWYRRNAREFPWRRKPTPYHVLLAEFLLQQTRADVGQRYYERFVARFPTLADLAAASQEEVLGLWSGLGYYRRARNLHATAQRIQAEFGGRVPQDQDALRSLPGIGPYTAGAIASIAYNQPTPAIDGNQLRVLGRLLGLREPERPAPRRRLEAWASNLLRQGSPRILNQALMDLGSRVCLPQKPRCHACPLAAACRYAARSAPSRPRRRVAPSKPVEDWEAVLHRRGDRVWLAAPRASGLLAHVWLPPLRPAQRPVTAPDTVEKFSHKTWRVRWVQARTAPRGSGRWVRRADLHRLPHGRLTALAFQHEESHASGSGEEFDPGPRLRPRRGARATG